MPALRTPLIPVVAILAALGALLAAPAPRAAVEEEPKHTLRLNYPARIGDLVFREMHPPAGKERATQLVYKSPGIVLTIYFYGGGPDLPDGIASPEMEREFASAKEAVHSPMAWKKAKDVSEGQVDLGTPPDVIPARAAVFKVQAENGGKANSYLYLAASHHVFFKVRCTSNLKKKDEESNLAAIRVAVGDLIHKSFELEPKAPDDAPPPPPPPPSGSATSAHRAPGSLPRRADLQGGASRR